MDVLDKYKETWKNQPEDEKKVSKVEIYKLAQKKSTSIVKWIFIIGLIEFFLMISMYFIDVPDLSVSQKFTDFYNYMGVFLTLLIVYFVYRFYRNYKNISTSDDTKTLMNKILATRKTVRTYVIINLVVMSFILMYEVWLKYQETFIDKEPKQIVIFAIVAIFIIVLTLLIALGVYQLIYGILLRKLNRNYKELAKLDELN